MINIEVDYLSFILTGKLGLFKVGTPWKQVINILGQAPLYEPSSFSLGTPALARYGDLEFAILHEKLSTISLIVVEDLNIELPPNIIMRNFGNARLSIYEVKKMLELNNLTWKRIDMLCDEWTGYYYTSNGVHLSFLDNLLGKVGSNDNDLFSRF